jgi:hypothetical protein
VRWVSWPGAAVDLGAQEAVRRRLDMEYSCTPVFLSPEIADAYYHKVCLWLYMGGCVYDVGVEGVCVCIGWRGDGYMCVWVCVWCLWCVYV